MYRADVIIRAKNGHEYTERCIESIRRVKSQVRIILVDDGSDTPQSMTGVDFYIRRPESRGSVTSINDGLRQSLDYKDTDYVIIMDNDTEIPEGDVLWLQRFIKYMEDPRVGAAGATCGMCNAPQHILKAPQVFVGEGEPECVTIVSFCVMLRKHAVREVGLWDERFNPGNFEDTDYGLRLREANWKCVVAGSVYVHHHCHTTFGDRLKDLLIANKKKMLEKWGAGKLWQLGIIPHSEMFAMLGNLMGSQQKSEGEDNFG